MENKGLVVDLWRLNDLPGMSDFIPTTGDGPAGPSVVDSSGNQSNSTGSLVALGLLYFVFIVLVEILYLTAARRAVACLNLLPYGIYVRSIRVRLLETQSVHCVYIDRCFPFVKAARTHTDPLRIPPDRHPQGEVLPVNGGIRGASHRHRCRQSEYD